MGGLGHASWLCWILVGILVLLIIANNSRWLQIGLSLAIILIGTPIFSGGSGETTSSTGESATTVVREAETTKSKKKESRGPAWMTDEDKEKIRKALYGF